VKPARHSFFFETFI